MISKPIYIADQKGFTVIELVMVLAILGILALSTIPRFNNSNIFLKTQGKILCSEIRQIQTSRMTIGGQFKIMLSPEKYIIRDGTKELKTVQLMQGYELLYDLNRSTIMFQHDGVPLYGGTTVRIRNKKNGRYIEITIVPASGRVLMKEEIYGS